MTTLLDITKSILSDMSGDVVNSIFDTEESEQVARIVISTFNAMASSTDWPGHNSLIQLINPTDNTKPTHMTAQSNLKSIGFINYNKIKLGETKKAYEKVTWKDPDDFLRLVNSRDSTSASIQIVSDPSGVELFIVNNRAPTYYTSFDDNTIVFDSFDSAVESTLQGTKTQVSAYLQATLDLSDTATPDLPPDALSWLVEEATARAQSKIAEFQDLTSEREAQRQRRSIVRKSWKINSKRRYPNYGRKV